VGIREIVRRRKREGLGRKLKRSPKGRTPIQIMGNLLGMFNLPCGE